MPTERSLDFRGSGLRLLRTLRPERGMIAAALLTGVASVALAVIGPRILGHATDLIFAGVIGRQFPSGMSKAAVIAQLRRSGQGNVADLLSGVNFTPGQGIDFTQVGRVLLVPLAVVVAAALGKRAQPQFVKQWSTTGRLNAHIEEMYSGHALVKVFGRQEKAAQAFTGLNETLFDAGFRAQFISGIIQPAMKF